MALYHRHRPQKFKEVVNQKHIIQTVTNQVKTEKPAHAYLFSGPRGVGKTSLARILAKALNCLKRKKNDSEPCGSCDSCSEISTGSAIDVIEIDAASHTGVDNVRQNIIENAQFRPTRLAYKIFIIDEVHMLSTAAFNALLKTLEEPPSQVLFILATTELHKVPVTIISRCQKFNFIKISKEDMMEHLSAVGKKEGIKLDQEVLERIAQKSEGCVRDAIGLLDHAMASGEKHISAELIEFIIPSSKRELQYKFINLLNENKKPEALTLIQEMNEEGLRFDQFAQDMISLLRDMAIYRYNKTLVADKFSEHERESLEQILESMESQKLLRLIELFMKRSEQISSAPLPSLPLEMLVLEWGQDSQENARTQDTTKNENTDASQGKQRKLKPEIPKTTLQPEAKPDVKPENSANSILEKTKVCESWPLVLSVVEKTHPSLVFILKMCEVDSVEGDCVILRASFDFHKEKIMESKSKQTIESAFSEILKVPVCMRVVFEQSPVDEAQKELQHLASAFGGELIS